MGGSAKERNMIIKPADKSYCFVLWDRKDYLTETAKQV